MIKFQLCNCMKLKWSQRLWFPHHYPLGGGTKIAHLKTASEFQQCDPIVLEVQMGTT